MTEIAYPKYSKEKSDASYEVLLRLAGELDSPANGYGVIGGMATYLLCREHAQFGPHVGTFDVDLALNSVVLPARPLMGERLKRAGLRPDEDNPRSMYWFADHSKDVVVPVDLLAPKRSDQSPNENEVAGIRAWCPPGTGAVLDSTIQLLRDGMAWGVGKVNGISITVANGPAVIMSKARSFKDRAYGQGRPVDYPKAGKHAYDLFFMMTSYSDSPAGLVKQWRELGHYLLKRKTIEILTDDFSNASSLGSTLAAGFIRANYGDSAGIEQMISEQVLAFVESIRQ